VLERALASDDEQEVLNALALVPHLEKGNVDTLVAPLLDHPAAAVRVKALQYFAFGQGMRFANAAFRRFDDPDPAVRAAAIDAFCAMGRDKAVRSVRTFLSDGDPRIRSSAVTGMIRFGGPGRRAGGRRGAQGFDRERRPRDEETRRTGAGAIGVRNFYQPVLQLMNDREVQVRREAIHAAGVLKSPEFVIPPDLPHPVARHGSRGNAGADAVRALDHSHHRQGARKPARGHGDSKGRRSRAGPGRQQRGHRRHRAATWTEPDEELRGTACTGPSRAP
jgi:hypothetical protein